MRTISLILLVCALSVSMVWGNSYYVDAVNGDDFSPGTNNQPWRTVEKFFFMAEGGDTVYLSSGNYGMLRLRGMNSETITIKAKEGETPQFSSIRIDKAKHWRIEGLCVSPEFGDAKKRGTLLDTDRESSDVVIAHCEFYSAKDTSKWTAKEWVEKSWTAVRVRGKRMGIVNNHIFNIQHGIEVLGEDSYAEKNLIENFSGDGMRVLGDRARIVRNVIRNCYDVDDNHDDGIQSWSNGPKGVGKGVVKGVVIEGNMIVNYSDPKQPHRGSLQGIGCFDGFFEDWVIANNIILVDHWHGVSLYGAKGCTIINNTVVDINDERPGPSWIRIADHKDKRKSTGNVVRNNLTTQISMSETAGTYDHNLIIKVEDYDSFFVNFGKLDLRLKAGCEAIDMGSNDGITKKDFFDHKRVSGSTVDVGAVEFHISEK